MQEWHDARVMGELEKKIVIQSIRGRVYVSAGVTFGMMVFTLFPTVWAISLGGLWYMVFLPIMFGGLGCYFLYTNNKQIKLIKNGNFVWRKDTVEKISHGGRYSTPKIYGQVEPDGTSPVYYPGNFLYSFHKGDDITCIHYDISELSARQQISIGSMPIAYIVR